MPRSVGVLAALEGAADPGEQVTEVALAQSADVGEADRFRRRGKASERLVQFLAFGLAARSGSPAGGGCIGDRRARAGSG